MLPNISSLEEYRRLYPDTQVWLPAMREIALRHSLPGEPHREALGSNVVYGFGEFVVKLFSPLWPDGFTAEKTALAQLPHLPVPDIVAEGELAGWPYLVLSRLAGIPAGSVWRSLSFMEREHIVRQLGELMRALHDHPVPADMPLTWGAFIRKRLARVEEHHNMPDPWPRWIREQLKDFQEPPMRWVLLNGDLTEDHVLLAQDAGMWRISGLIDFGDARVGHPYYDFIAPLAYYTYGEPELSTVLLESYGLTPSGAVCDDLIKYCLLHEFGRLSHFLKRYPVDTPEHFYQAMWGQRPGGWSSTGGTI